MLFHLPIARCCTCFHAQRQAVRFISFLDISLEPVIARKLRKYDIDSPTYIQQQVFQSITNGENVVINSETGSGKTLAYALPILQKIHKRKRANLQLPRPTSVVLLPSIELCYQVGDVFRTLLGANVCLVTKDHPMHLIETDIVVSTPQAISTYPYNVLNESETIVIDEADILIDRRIGKHGRKDPFFKFMNHMLDPLNKPQLSDRQFIFVGATMPDSANKKSRKAMPYIRAWLPDIKVIKGTEAHKLISHLDMVFVSVDEGNKLKQLVTLVEELDQRKSCLKILVFVNTVNNAQKLYRELTYVGSSERLNSGAKDLGIYETFPQTFLNFQMKWTHDLNLVHRDIPRNDRLYALENFNNSSHSILITTDVSARGLDFKDVDIVVQYDFAKNVTDIIHRAGRTGRLGKEGTVINFVTSSDERLASIVQQMSEEREHLDHLFSRRRGLSRALKNRDKGSDAC